MTFPPGAPGWIAPTLPWEPLQRALDERGVIPSTLGQTLNTAIHRARRQGHLSVYAVDKIAVRVLGIHPVLIYGVRAWCDPESEAA